MARQKPKRFDICVSCGELKQIYAVGKCQLCYHRTYKEANREHIKEMQRLWYRENREHCLGVMRRYTAKRRKAEKARRETMYLPS